MPSEPDKPIEKLLRAYGRKRREASGAAPDSMHPATRRLLQGEVARQLPSSAAGKRARPGGALWSRWVLGFSIVLCLGIVCRLWIGETEKKSAQLATRDLALATRRQSTNRFDLSSNRSLQDRPSAAELDSGPRPAKLDADKNLKSDSKALPGAGAGTPAAKEAEVALAPRPSGAGGRFGEKPANLSIDPARAFTPESLAFQGVSGKMDPASNSSYFLVLTAGRGQRFTQEPVLPAAKQIAPAPVTAPSVLHSFDLRQVGDTVRVADGDGSLYDGRWISAGEWQMENQKAVDRQNAPQAPAVELKAALFKDTMARAQRTENRPGTNRSYFQVSGTNRSLKQMVILWGELVPENSLAPVLNTPPALAAAPLKRSATTTLPANAGNSATRLEAQSQLSPGPHPQRAGPNSWRLHGRALVGATNELLIDARQVEP